METLWQDVKFGARMLAKSPGFTVVAVLTLALGIGANTAIFTVVNAVLLRPLPFEEPDRLAMVWEANAARNRAINVINPGNFLDWREQNSVFADMAAFLDTTANLTNVEDPEEIRVTLVNINFFSVLGAKPQMGRTFTTDDGREGQDNVVVIGHGFWLRRLGGDPNALGKEIHLNGQPRTIIGEGYAATLAVPLWGRFMIAATRGDAPDTFNPPRTVTSATICRISGRLATDACRGVQSIDRDGNVVSGQMVYTEYFVRGTEPGDYCPFHTFGASPQMVTVSSPPQVPRPVATAAAEIPVPIATTGVLPAAAAAAPSPPRADTAPDTVPETARRGFWGRFFRRGNDGAANPPPASPEPHAAPPSR